jgi:hypothetical protein
MRAHVEANVVLAMAREEGVDGAEVIEVVGDIAELVAEIEELVPVLRVGMEDELRDAEPRGRGVAQVLPDLGEEGDPVALEDHEVVHDLALLPVKALELLGSLANDQLLLLANEVAKAAMVPELLPERADDLLDEPLEFLRVSFHGPLWSSLPSERTRAAWSTSAFPVLFRRGGFRAVAGGRARSGGFAGSGGSVRDELRAPAARPIIHARDPPAGIASPRQPAPVAQLDRVVAFEAIGWGFESLRVRQVSLA